METGSRGASWRWCLGGVALVVVALAHFPFLLAHVAGAWHSPTGRGSVLALPAAGLLAIRNLSGVGEARPGRFGVAALGLTTAWVFLLAACWTSSPWLGTVAASMALGAIAYETGGSRWLKGVAPAMVLMVAAAPLPLGLGEPAGDWLAGRAERAAGHFLDGMSIPHLWQGPILRLPGLALNSRNGSALDHLAPLLALVMAATFWQGHGLARLGARLLASAVWLFAAEVVRLVGLALALENSGIDLASGRRGKLVGLAALLLALLFTVNTDQIFKAFAMAWRWLTVGPCRPSRRSWAKSTGRFVGEVRESLSWLGKRGASRPIGARRTSFWGLAVAAYALLLVSQFWLLRPLAVGMLSGPGVPEWVAAAGPFAMPERLGEFTREAVTALSAVEGLDAPRVWLYRRGDCSVELSLQGPFAERPDARDVAGPDWRENDRSVTTLSDGSELVISVLGRDDGSHACVGSFLVDIAGRPVTPPPRSSGALERLRRKARDRDNPPTYEIAAIIRSDPPPNLAQRGELARFLDEARRALFDGSNRRKPEEHRP